MQTDTADGTEVTYASGKKPKGDVDDINTVAGKEKTQCNGLNWPKTATGINMMQNHKHKVNKEHADCV